VQGIDLILPQLAGGQHNKLLWSKPCKRHHMSGGCQHMAHGHNRCTCAEVVPQLINIDTACHMPLHMQIQVDSGM
jgi:hypothetical protein